MAAPAPDQPADDGTELAARVERLEAENRALRAEVQQMRDRAIEQQVASAKANRPDDMFPLKRAADLAGVHPERVRRMHHDGEIISQQRGKGAKIFASVSSIKDAIRNCFL